MRKFLMGLTVLAGVTVAGAAANAQARFLDVVPFGFSTPFAQAEQYPDRYNEVQYNEDWRFREWRRHEEHERWRHHHEWRHEHEEHEHRGW